MQRIEDFAEDVDGMNFTSAGSLFLERATRHAVGLLLGLVEAL